MTALSRSVRVFSIIDALIISAISFLNFYVLSSSYSKLFAVMAIYVASIMLILGLKGFYTVRKYHLKDIYLLFEGIFIGSFLAALFSSPILGGLAVYLTLIELLLVFICFLTTRLVYVIYKTLF